MTNPITQSAAEGHGVQPEHECPGCKYRMTDTAFCGARFDFLCPRCRKYRLSEFRIIKQEAKHK